MPGYHYTHAGGQYGPVSGQQLKQLAAQGQLVPEDYVWTEDENRRFLARDVRGLFVMATPPPVAIESRIPEAEVISYASSVSCPSCHNRFINDGSLAGQTVKCLHCNTPMQMPQEGSSSVPPVIATSQRTATSAARTTVNQPNDPYDFLNGPDSRPSSLVAMATRHRSQLKGLAVTLATTIGSITVLALLYIYGLPKSDARVKAPTSTIAANGVPNTTEAEPSQASARPQQPNVQPKRTAVENAIPEEPTSAAVPGTMMTKDEWKERAWKIRSSTGNAPYSEIQRIFGKPFRTQTIADKQFWYWKCQDGIIQAEVVAVGDTVYLIGVNDYWARCCIAFADLPPTLACGVRWQTPIFRRRQTMTDDCETRLAKINADIARIRKLLHDSDLQVERIDRPLAKAEQQLPDGGDTSSCPDTFAHMPASSTGHLKLNG